MAGFGGSVKLTGESEYRKALQEITNNLTVLSSEMKITNSEFDKSDKSIDGLTNTNKKLNEQIDQQFQKILGLQQALENARKGYGENSKQATKWEAELNSAKAELNVLNRELDKNEKVLKDAENQLEENSDELEKFAKNEDKAGQSAIKMGDLIKANVISDAIVGGVKALGSAMKEVASRFIDFVKSGVENASNLQEVQNVVDTVFGESAKTIDEFAKNAGVQFGMTELSAKKFAGSMGAMLDSMGIAPDQTTEMSTSLVGLAGDMASFYNLDHEDTWTKIRSGIAGETEPLKQLGINMSVANLEAYALSQGINKSFKEMTQAEQATLRYNYLMEATANAQGDFAKTSDGFANQQRILSLQFENLATNIGTFLLPTLNEALIVFNDMMSGEISMEQGIGQLSQIVVDLVNAIVERLPELLNAGMTMLETLLQGFMNMIPNILPAVVQLLTSLVGFIIESLPMIVDSAIQIVLALANGLGQALPTLVPAVIGAILTIVENLIDNVDLIIDAGIQLIMGLADGLIEAIPILLEKIPVIIEKLITGFYRNHAKISATGWELIVKLAQGLISAIPDVIRAIPKIIAGIINGFKNGFSEMRNVGKNMLQGLWQGMGEWAGELYNKVKNLGKDIVGWFKGTFGIHSPSTVFADEIGKNMALGVGVGFEDTMAGVTSQMTSAIPTDFETNINATAGAGARADTNTFGNMVEAFKTALKEVKIILDDEVAGEFVTSTVERVVYS